MPITNVRATPEAIGSVAVPSDVRVTFAARDLGGGAKVVVTYSVLDAPDIRVEGATKRRSAVISVDGSSVSHVVALERVPGVSVASEFFTIEAAVLEDGSSAHYATWNAQVTGTDAAHNKLMASKFAEPGAADTARRLVRIAKERAAILRVTKRLVAAPAGAKKAEIKKAIKKATKKATKK